jgi:hypothetical protein
MALNRRLVVALLLRGDIWVRILNVDIVEPGMSRCLGVH